MKAIILDDIKRYMLDYDKSNVTDEYYLTLANYIANMSREINVFPEMPDSVINNLSISLVSYYQDIIADAGIWRAFVTMCRHLYNHPVPFYDEPEDYIDYELNGIDVSFNIWYSLEAMLGFNGIISPTDSDILRLSKKVTKLFKFLYDDAPTVESFSQIRELDLKDREQARNIFTVSGWLFWNSYFMRPISKFMYEPDIADEDELTIEDTLRDENRLRTTFEQPTGPLALRVEEWLELIINNQTPQPKKGTNGIHKYYRQFTEVTNGEIIKFFPDYQSFNNFLINSMHWGKVGEDCFPHLKEFSNFIIYANKEKGILIAPNIAQYIKHINNTSYNSEVAEKEAHLLLLVPGRCPVDLINYLFENELVPDAKFPTGENADSLLHDNWRFLARLYQCKFHEDN